jgi:ferritin-like protein
MGDSSETLHEAPELLSRDTVDRHRAIASLREEMEAVDWYDQRIDATQDRELRDILAHNRDEEKEHAAMLLEWLRRHDAKIAEMLETYIAAKGPITRVEEQETEDGQDTGASRDLGIGSLREVPSNG